MKTLILISLLLVACAKNNDSKQSISLDGSWSEAGATYVFSESNSYNGSFVVAYDLGTICKYSYQIASVFDPDLHDLNSGVMTISGGQALNSNAAVSCSGMNGSWDFYVLSTPALQLCQSGVCKELK